MRVYSPQEASDYLEAFGQFYAALNAQQWYGDHVCLAAQPSHVHGSPDEIVEDGVEEGALVTADWTKRLVESVDGMSTEGQIRSALAAAAESIDVEELGEILFEKMLTALMLGGLDSQWEREHEEEIAPAKFKDEKPFMPRQSAIELWEQRDVMGRAEFDALQDELKRRSFTFAGTARDELLNAAHAELGRQMRTDTVDLRQFRKFAEERLESAGWTPANPSHVETIFRTNVASSMSSGRYAEQTQPDVLENLPYWQIRAIRDARARRYHKQAHGIVLPANHAFWRKAYPPFGYNCFLAGTEIRGNVLGASRAWYSGKAIELTTAKGRRLSVTANHPILTAQGLVPAKALRQGDQLIGYLGESGVELLGSSPKRHEDDRPASAEHVFRALAELHPVHLAGTAPNDFHGEARRFMGQIQVVGSYGNLARTDDTSLSQECAEVAFETPDPPRPGHGAAGHLFRGAPVAPDSAPGGSALSLDSLAVHSTPLDPLRFGAPARLDSLLTQDANDGRARDTELFGDLLHRGLGLVEADEILDVREFDFCDHVYDFQTSNGWLFADSIVASNCRCRVIARTSRWIERTGATIGPVPRGLPDPGFSSGTSAIVTVPENLKRRKAPKEDPPPEQPEPAGLPQPDRSPAFLPPVPPLPRPRATPKKKPRRRVPRSDVRVERFERKTSTLGVLRKMFEQAGGQYPPGLPPVELERRGNKKTRVTDGKHRMVVAKERKVDVPAVLRVYDDEGFVTEERKITIRN